VLDGLLLLARLVLAGVFLVAALAKLTDRNGSRKTMVDFGLPSVLSTPLGVLLPLAELAVAITLLPAMTAWWGAASALAVLALFVAGIVVNLARGRRPECHCFGQIASKPISWRTLVRNGMLSAVAGLIVWQGPQAVGPSAVAWLGWLAPLEALSLGFGIVGLVLLIGIVWLLVQLWQLIGRLLLRVDDLEAHLPSSVSAGNPALVVAPPAEPGLPVGSPAPTFRLDGLYGEMLTLDALRAAGKPVVLVFANPDCGPCNALMPDVGRWQRDYGTAFAVSVISQGSVEANQGKTAEYGLTSVLLQHNYEVSQAFQASGSPSAVLVRPDGTIGSPVAAGADAIRALVTKVTGGDLQLPIVQANGYHHDQNGHAHVHTPQAERASARIGEHAPALKLPDLNGTMVDLEDFRGSRTLVLFWNPSCGYCQQMLGDLKEFEAKPLQGAPKLLAVSTGSVEANEAMGLRAHVLLDASFKTALNFGATGTPSAVLVDEEGRISSEVALGAPAVLALTTSQQLAAMAQVHKR
jgi:peroxiredoxin